MAYVKLDCGILDSTLWLDFDARNVFITALLMAEPVVFDAPVQAFAVDTLQPDGFIIPPGWYGVVSAAAPGIIYRSMVDMKTGMKALSLLASPDSMSRSKDFDGRRMVPINGGFCILNYDKYREKDHTSKDRSRRYRLRKAGMPDRITVADIDGIIESFRSAWAEKFPPSSWHFDGILRKSLPNLAPTDVEPIKHAFDAHVSKLEATKFFNPEKFCATWRAHLES